ncbi:hypothetical protein COCNU_07G014770 [Cocos nucifera]|uniref:Uncharacterized protein n=1 Tax=Cocos nucifera TaxID=13894 RepID=A0A8K0IGB8_COCNU|nr:hypothetical protein COCNU_07G014770 [Cocos nucifera]
MMGGMRRSLSFPIPRCAALSPWHRHPVRSSSLSCRFHPVVSHLVHKIRGLRAWHAAPLPLCGSPNWIAAGLERLDALLAALADLLFLPQAQEPLRRHRLSPWTDRLLDDFLRLADAHGSFRAALTELKSYQADAQVALRRNDKPRLASAVQAQRRAEKEFIRLAAGIRDVARWPGMAEEEEEEDSGEAEMAGIMRKVTVAALAASGTVMVGVAAVSGAATEAAAGGTGRLAWGAAVLRWRARAKAMMKKNEEGRGRKREREKAAAWRGAVLAKMEMLEECIEALESSSERVFRTLVNTRVSLLNILTPSF